MQSPNRRNQNHGEIPGQTPRKIIASQPSLDLRQCFSEPAVFDHEYIPGASIPSTPQNLLNRPNYHNPLHHPTTPPDAKPPHATATAKDPPHQNHGFLQQDSSQKSGR